MSDLKERVGVLMEEKDNLDGFSKEKINMIA